MMRKEKRRLHLNQHETTHTNIVDQKTNKIRVILTSFHGNKPTPNVTYHYLKFIKTNGSFTPLIDPTTKQPIKNAAGNLILDPQKSEQWVAVVATSLDVGHEISHKIEPRHDYQKY